MQTLRAVWIAAWLAVLGVGCSDAYDERQLERPVDDPTTMGEGDAATSMPMGGGGSSAGTGGAGRPGTGGATMPPIGGSGSTPGVPSAPGCQENPDDVDGTCPSICTESCNGADDDCDGIVDEGEASDACLAPNAVSVCQSGSCLIVECEGRFRDCDQQASTGCEASLDDVSTCGACDNVCEIANAVEACVDGVCVPAECDRGYDECDADPGTICETAVQSALQCGGCTAACALDHAVPDCVDVQCVVSRCDGGHGDCDLQPANGCEQPLDTLEHCGMCGQPCALASCAGGVCSAVVCTDPSADCDGNGVDCEVDLSNDAQHCGACTTACALGPSSVHASSAICAAKTCEAVCDGGFADCDPDYRNGCETALDTRQNCGACGNNCDTSLANTASTACAAATSCEVVTCDPGFGNCDNQHPNGCEANTYAPANCGGCASTGDNEPCTGLPNATATSCPAGACRIDTCQSGYADCDGLAANGCERNTTMLGPCFPDTNCTRMTYGTSEYFFCTNDSTWTAARDKCRLQTRGDLVHIESAGENGFVQAGRVADAWIGGSDSGLEGLWRWSNDGMPFFRGLGSGAAVLSQYENFVSPQPDDYMSNEDCAEIYSNGTWNDQNCAATRDFVCEVVTDACPSDASKNLPGQCGCGNPDTDSDNDGFAVCNDACDSDPAKQATGLCGCGVPDTNTDGDSQPDCSESCDSDPNKLAPGACGCGVADADGDGDGTANCNDPCPNNSLSTSSATGCGLGFVPSNVNVTQLNPTIAGATTTIGCAAVLNTSGTPSFTTWCTGPQPQITLQTIPGGPEVAVVATRDLSITSTGSVRVSGSRPAVFVIFGNATIAGTIDASASGITVYGGGNYNCGTSTGINVANCGNETGGGGGGGFGTSGGTGGLGDDCNGGAGGIPRGAPSLIPLLGGCGGGRAGGCTTAGAGGGAIQITVGGSLTLSGTLRANGGIGPDSCGSQYGGGGGGSGGGIRVEAQSLTTTGSTVQTNGGRGGNSGGSGGSGSTSSATNGGNGSGASASGGGGGGGGYGRIVLCNRTTNAGCP